MASLYIKINEVPTRIGTYLRLGKYNVTCFCSAKNLAIDILATQIIIRGDMQKCASCQL